MPEFLAYVAWMQEEGTSRDVVWVPNAYPRAAYYLGYIAIERGAFEAAVAVLDHGLRLQPDSGKLAHEKAQALLRAGRLDEAGAVYREVLGRPGFLPPADRAAQLRGRGYLEIERHDLDAAERTFREALALEPDSPVARNELEYIAVLRGG
jgi:Flp pilus assembly protein TadD